MLLRRDVLKVMLASMSVAQVEASPPIDASSDADSVAELKDAVTKLRPAFDRFEPTSWSTRHPDERRQSLDGFISSMPNRPTAEHDRLYLQPIGKLPQSFDEAINATIELLVATFGVPVKQLPAIGIDRFPETAKRVHPNWGVPQVLTTYILDGILKPQRPRDAVAVLGITASDLWPGKDWNFVFGQASLSERVGIWSLNRFGEPQAGEAARGLFLMRTLKVAIHETGHMFGIRHCVHFRCGMNGSNNLKETDDGPLAVCPECLAKLCWSTKRSPREWLSRTLDVAKKYKLPDQSTWEDCLTLLKTRPLRAN